MANLVKFEGTFKWAKTKRLDKFGKWSVQFYPKDAATRKAVKDLGARVSIKEDDDGFYYQFSRRAQASWGQLTPPFVKDADGKDLTVDVGNGSKGFVVLDLYEYRGGVDDKGNHYDGGKALRWEGLEITDLTVYQRPDQPQNSSVAANNEPPF